MNTIAARFWLTLSLMLVIAGPSWGLAFTLEASIPFDNGNGTTGTINRVLDPVGTIAATAGTVSAPLGGPQDVFYFSVTVLTGAIDFLGVTVGSPTATLGNPRGVGYLDGAGEAPTGIAADNVIDLAAEYAFANPFLSAGETSRRLFLTQEVMLFDMGCFCFVPSGPSEIALGQSVQFMLSPGLNFDVQGIVAPEPSTAALLALGLVGMGVTVRSRRKR